MVHRHLFLCVLWASVCSVPAAEHSRLAIDLGPHPRIMSYRGEYLMSKWSDEEIETLFSRCDGVSMKFVCGDELGKPHQYDNIERYLDIAERVKKRNPSFVVLEHFLLDSHLLAGTLSDPARRSALADFFPGHYLYCLGSRLAGPVDADTTELSVEEPERFLVGDYARILRTDDVTDTAVWRASEVVQVEVKAGSTLTVRRGIGHTQARPFPAGASLRPHMKAHWPNPDLVMYNLTRHSPLDDEGRTCPEALAHWLATWFASVNAKRPGLLDGIEFDVMMHYPSWRMFVPTPKHAGGRQFRKIYGVFKHRLVDTDLDGRPDGGYPQGRPAWGVGTLDFLRALRRRLGNEVILIGDCIGTLSRGVPYTNGLMNEDFPDIGAVWSFSAAFQRIEDYLARISPSLRPFLFNVNKPDKRIGRIFRFGSSAQKLRFQTAANLIMGAAIAGFGEPTLMRKSRLKDGIADEYQAGDVGRRHWLGAPLGPYRRVSQPGALVKRWQHDDDTTLEWDRRFYDVTSTAATPWRRLCIKSVPQQSDRPDPDGLVVYSLTGVEFTAGKDYTLTVPLYAESIYASLPDPHVGIPYGCYVSFTVNGKPQGRNRGLLVYDEQRAFRLTLMPDRSGPGEIRLHLGYEPGTVHIGECELHDGTHDRMVRAFEHGAALLNASQTAYTFDLARLFPGRRLSRIKASTGSQSPLNDPAVNTGEPARDSVSLGPFSGLVLMADASPRVEGK